MKIWSFTTVKDEEDIIESFVRYHSSFLDGMVISDNCSNDSTLEILHKLKEEGYPIDILEDSDSYFDQVKKRHELLQYTITNYHPDFILPLDADEFVCAKEGKNPKDVIATLPKDVPSSYLMRNYVYTGDVTNELFVPKCLMRAVITYEGTAQNYKCIIPDEIFAQGINLVMGSHFVATADGKPLPSVLCENLFLAHFPVRSRLQIMNKVITGRLNHSSLYSRNLGMGYHQYEILDEIIKTGTLSEEFLFSYSCYYSIQDKTRPIELQEAPVSTEFAGNIELKYTSFGDENVLINTLKTAFTVIERMREAKELCEKEREECHRQYDRLQEQHRRLEETYHLIINSKVWRLKAKFDRLIGRAK